MKQYSVTLSEVRPYGCGTHLNILSEAGVMVGEINATRKRGVTSLELKRAMHSLLRENDTFDALARRASDQLPSFAETLSIRFIF